MIQFMLIGTILSPTPLAHIVTLSGRLERVKEKPTFLNLKTLA